MLFRLMQNNAFTFNKQWTYLEKIKTAKSNCLYGRFRNEASCPDFWIKSYCMRQKIIKRVLVFALLSVIWATNSSHIHY